MKEKAVTEIDNVVKTLGIENSLELLAHQFQTQVLTYTSVTTQTLATTVL